MLNIYNFSFNIFFHEARDFSIKFDSTLLNLKCLIKSLKYMMMIDGFYLKTHIF
jgi:hypothetical protein